jgi:hypothetical protein
MTGMSFGYGHETQGKLEKAFAPGRRIGRAEAAGLIAGTTRSAPPSAQPSPRDAPARAATKPARKPKRAVAAAAQPVEPATKVGVRRAPGGLLIDLSTSPARLPSTATSNGDKPRNVVMITAL